MVPGGTGKVYCTQSSNGAVGPQDFTALLAGWPWTYLDPWLPRLTVQRSWTTGFWSFPALNISKPNYDPKHLYMQQNCLDTCLWVAK
jgi:hypothetical protein